MPKRVMNKTGFFTSLFFALIVLGAGLSLAPPAELALLVYLGVGMLVLASFQRPRFPQILAGMQDQKGPIIGQDQ